MALVTVITATYNRAHTLPFLYESLRKQNKHLKWLVVDDGSTDGTEQVINGFEKDELLDICYIKKENGGKHTALNVGVREIDTPLTVIVDSDDTLLPNALDSIERIYDKYKNNKKIGFYTFLKCYSNGKPVVSLERDEFVENYIDYRIKHERPGDMAEVFLSDILKKYKFPEFPGEHFISEDIVWIEIGKHFDSVYINKSIYECEYLEGGLTANDKSMKFASPLGSMMRGKQLMSVECGMKINIKGAIIYNCYQLQTDGKIPEALLLTARERVLVILTKPIGRFFFNKWKK